MTLTPVGKTALAVARARAEESVRPDQLFDDPYAGAFVSAAPNALPDLPAQSEEARKMRADLDAHVATRTIFFDRYLLDACAGGCRQVVLLAAGLDTRAFRLDWPSGVQLYEVDRADVLSFKHAVLDSVGAREPRCARTIVEADLALDWPPALAAAGFDPALPTAWLAEGLMVYLTAPEMDGLLSHIGDLSAAGSRLSFERSPKERPSEPDWIRDLPAAKEFEGLWKGGLGNAAPRRLEQLGWTVSVTEQADLARSLDREPPAGVQWGYLTAAR